MVAKQQEVAKTAAKQEGFAAQEEIAKLKRRIEELRRQLERLQTVEGWVRAARANSLVLETSHFEAIKSYYIRKKGYSPEQKQLAKDTLTELVSKGLEAGAATIVFGRLP